MDFIIIDDEPAAIDVLKFHLEKIPFMTLKESFRDSLDALEYLQNNKVDLIFLDINMPKLSGITFPEFLEDPPLIIFTTAYSEYALESYNLNALDYLLKPIEFDRLLKAVMKARRALKKGLHNEKNDPVKINKQQESIFIKSGTKLHQISFKDIKYVESDGNYVTFFCTEQNILARYKISEVIDLLPPQSFVRIHRSYIIALSQLDIVKKHCVIIDNKELPISSKYRTAFIKLIESFLG